MFNNKLPFEKLKNISRYQDGFIIKYKDKVWELHNKTRISSKRKFQTKIKILPEIKISVLCYK